MAGVISPSMESAMTIPMGPMIKSASRLPVITGFSPVAPASAPAFNIAAVAVLLVPSARTGSSGHTDFSCSTMARPMRPPWPSITITFIRSSPFPPGNNTPVYILAIISQRPEKRKKKNKKIQKNAEKRVYKKRLFYYNADNGLLGFSTLRGSREEDDRMTW